MPKDKAGPVIMALEKIRAPAPPEIQGSAFALCRLRRPARIWRHGFS
jgi:hypothetical protein